MASQVSIVIKTTGGDVAAKQIRGVGDAGQHAATQIDIMGDKATKASGPLSGLMKGLGGVAQIAGGFVVGTALTQLPGLIGGLTSAASDSAESMSKAKTIFGEGFGAIDKFAKGAADAVGLSKQKAYEATGTFGNLFVQLGIGKDTAAKMSTSLVTLASDFASFHNADISDVIDAQAAAFRGEYDALQRYVPTINAAAVQQEALAMSGKKTTAELTEQDKALAVQSLMMKGAGDAVGDFTRTKEGDANQTRILQAKYEDLSATLGTKLLPIQIAVKGAILDAIPVAVELGAALGDKLAPAAVAVAEGAKTAWENADKLTPALLAAEKAGKVVYDLFKPLAEDILQELLEVFEELTPPVRDDLIPALKQLEPILEPLSILAGAMAVGPLYLLLQAIKFLTPWVGEYLYYAIKILSAEINAAVAIVEAIGAAFDTVAGPIQSAYGAISDFGENATRPIQWVIDRVWQLINAIRSIPTPSLGGLGGAIGNLNPFARAEGGPVSAGQMYLVGERGPEFFIPGNSGRIANNAESRQMAGGPGGVTIQIEHLYARDEGEARQAAGFLGYAVQTEMRGRGLTAVRP